MEGCRRDACLGRKCSGAYFRSRWRTEVNNTPNDPGDAALLYCRYMYVFDLDGYLNIEGVRFYVQR